MRYIGGRDSENAQYLWDWMAARWPTEGRIPIMPRDFDALYHGEVVDKKLNILGIVGFTEWTHSTCMMHVASDGTGRWASRDFFYEVYHYLFDTNGLTSVYAVALLNNPKAIALHRKLGHRELTLLKHYDGKGKHALLFTMTFEDWAVSKWNKKRAALQTRS